jgi:hypothetical protein
MSVRWSLVGVVLVGILAVAPLRPVGSALGDDKPPPQKVDDLKAREAAVVEYYLQQDKEAAGYMAELAKLDHDLEEIERTSSQPEKFSQAIKAKRQAVEEKLIARRNKIRPAVEAEVHQLALKNLIRDDFGGPGLKPAEPPRPPEPSRIGKFQFIELTQLGNRNAFDAPAVLFDTETGKTWKLDKTNPDKLVWKLAMDAPK